MSWGRTSAAAPKAERRARVPGAGFPNGWILGQRQPSRAVSRNRNYRTSIVLNVPPERCARELEVAEAIDCAYFAIRRAGSSKKGIGQVSKPATEMHVAFQQPGHRTQMNFGLRDCEHLTQPDDSARRAERQRKNVETYVEYLPRPRRWPRNVNYITGRIAVVLNRR